MPVGPDLTQSGQIKVYIKQSPLNTSFNGNTVISEEVTDVGGLQSQYGLADFNGQILPGLIGFTIFQGASSGICNVGLQVQDNGGQALTQTDGHTPTVFHLDVSLANANGTITSLTPSTGLAVVTGTLLNTYIAGKAFYVETNGAGLAVVSITDTGKQGFYVMVQAGMQPVPALSRQLLTADYHV
jgi:hypothetical protein